MSPSRRFGASLRLALFFIVALPVGSRAADAGSTPNSPVSQVSPVPADSTRRARAFSIQRELAKADSLLKLRGGVHAENAQLFLSWNAPWGMKRARTTLEPVCADTTTADTLYLSFLPGRPSAGFSGFSARLAFHGTGTDTLGPWWHWESKGGENGGNVQVEFGPTPELPGRMPWAAVGYGFSQLKRTPTDVNLLLLYAVSQEAAVPIVEDSLYTLARVVIRHRRTARLEGCGQPVCVEWQMATFAFALKDEPEVRRGERFVTYGSQARACESRRGSAVPAWKPRK